MILKASQRGNAKELATHLLNGATNEHVTVHEIRGFMSQDLTEALEEVHAISRGTRCSQFLFSVSLNPPELKDVPIESFEAAIADIEKAMNLIGQPRIIVFHEKNGRRHCHCIWSRIDSATLTAINMAYYKYKLKRVSRSLFLKNGWKLPKGLQRKFSKDKSKTYNQTEWQQTLRTENNPDKIKEIFQQCWDMSDDRKSFASALQEHGFYLAKGDRRGYIVTDYQGEIYSLSRYMKHNTKEIKTRLGDPSTLPSLKEAQTFLKYRLTEQIKVHIVQRKVTAKEERAPLVHALRDMVTRQREERDHLLQSQQKRFSVENKARSSRIRQGVTGLWDKATGKYQENRARNEQETKLCLKRDRAEQQSLIQKHLKESRHIHKALALYKNQEEQERQRFNQGIAEYINTNTDIAIKPKVDLPALIQNATEQIDVLSGDIEMLQISLSDNKISDDMRARIRILLNRAKETLRIKDSTDIHTHKETPEEKEERLYKLQKQFYKWMQELEVLKTKQRQIEVNKGFYKTITDMTYRLNGIPLYEIKLTQKYPFYEQSYMDNIRHKPLSVLLKHHKHGCAVTELRQNTLHVKEALNRAKKKPLHPTRDNKSKNNPNVKNTTQG